MRIETNTGEYHKGGKKGEQRRKEKKGKRGREKEIKKKKKRKRKRGKKEKRKRGRKREMFKGDGEQREIHYVPTRRSYDIQPPI